ncbi:MAG: hypothetical protein JSR66_22605 [Proteobacteria bacterium]|nr:hypothetical protein [Pseudomonadota bacterium]
MRTFKQPVTTALVRALVMAAVSTISLSVWAQSSNQAGSLAAAPANTVAPANTAPPANTTAPGNPAAPPKKASPPPADLEPGVNTSATQSSSPEPEPAAPPAPVPKATPTTSKRAPAASSTPPSPAGTAGGSANAPPTGTAGGEATSVASKPGHATAAATPKAAGKAHDSLELDTTQITGNRELPKVLYIVPWKRSDLGDLVGKPVNSLLDEVLTPVDRDVFKRQNRYYDALKPDNAKDAAGTASDPANGKH